MNNDDKVAGCLDTAGETSIFKGGFGPAGALIKRDKAGSLLSIRIPVTPGNRQVLRSIRAAEQAAWEAGEKAAAPAGRR
jgi:hypothetical protein